MFKDVESNPPPKWKKSRRSFKGMTDQPLPVYITGKHYDPSPLQLTGNEKRDILFADQEKINLLWILCRSVAIPQTIASWRGFHIPITS